MIYIRLAAIALAFLAGWFVNGWRYGEQIATMQKEAAEATTKAVQEARDEERANQKRKDDALAEANLRAQKNAALARALDGDVDRLRAQIASTASSLPSKSCDTVRNYSSILGDIFGESVQRYSEVARTLDQCVSDLRLMQDAWPD